MEIGVITKEIAGAGGTKSVGVKTMRTGEETIFCNGIAVGAKSKTKMASNKEVSLMNFGITMETQKS